MLTSHIWKEAGSYIRLTLYPSRQVWELQVIITKILWTAYMAKVPPPTRWAHNRIFTTHAAAPQPLRRGVNALVPSDVTRRPVWSVNKSPNVARCHMRSLDANWRGGLVVCGATGSVWYLRRYRPSFGYISYQEIQTLVEMFSGWNLTSWELTSGEMNMSLSAPQKYQYQSFYRACALIHQFFCLCYGSVFLLFSLLKSFRMQLIDINGYINMLTS